MAGGTTVAVATLPQPRDRPTQLVLATDLFLQPAGSLKSEKFSLLSGQSGGFGYVSCSWKVDSSQALPVESVTILHLTHSFFACFCYWSLQQASESEPLVGALSLGHAGQLRVGKAYTELGGCKHACPVGSDALPFSSLSPPAETI